MPNYNPQTNGWQSSPNKQTSPMAVPRDLRAKYQIPPLPPSVKKIAGLVKGRQSASMDEIVGIIDNDRLVTQRLITMAFPKAAARKDATVQMAASRLGVTRVIIVIVGDLLTQAVIETFETMVALPLEIDDPTLMPSPESGELIGSVKFKGGANGEVRLSFSPYLSLFLTARLNDGNLEDKYPPEVITDTIGELVNIVTGNLQSRLCDAGLPSEVGLPEVKPYWEFKTENIPGSSSEQFYFRGASHGLGVHLCIAPF
jgi:chemotaxis protein CheX